MLRLLSSERTQLFCRDDRSVLSFQSRSWSLVIASHWENCSFFRPCQRVQLTADQNDRMQRSRKYPVRATCSPHRAKDKNVAWKATIPGRKWFTPVLSDGKAWITTATHIPAPQASSGVSQFRWQSLSGLPLNKSSTCQALKKTSQAVN